MARTLLFLGSIYGFLAVALGAFAAHALRAHVVPEDLEIFKTATTYQLAHSVVLLIVGVFALWRPGQGFERAGLAFAIGILIFSGTLYLLVLTQTRWLGAITPIGGVSLLVGWALLAYSICKSGGPVG